MKNICIYFTLHAPYRLKRYRFFEIGQDHYYYDDFQTEDKITHLAQQSYLPANRTILDMIRSSNGKFKCAFAISGIVLEQLEQYAPEVIDSFKELAKTGSVEFLAEPYAHSLAPIFNANEWESQLKQHADKIESLFGLRPVTLCNPDLLYSDEIASRAYSMGFKAMMMEAAKHVMGWKSPNYIYRSAAAPKLKLLVRNTKLSDDIAFRFSDYSWQDFPLDAAKYMGWINETPAEEPIINIGFGYDALGINNNAQSGIFDFIKALPFFAMESGIGFMLPAEAAKKITAVEDFLTCPSPMTWAGSAKDVSAWCGNDLQNEALSKLYSVAERVRLCSDKSLKRDWDILQASDNFRYMSHSDAWGTNYESAYEAFMNYMNVLADFLQRVEEQYPTTIENEELNALLETINNQEKEIEELEKSLKAARSRKSAAK